MRENVEPEARKRTEAEFHDQMRALYEQNPEEYAKYTANKKYYDITESSQRYFSTLLRTHCTGKRVLDFGCGSGALSFQVAEYARSVNGIDISEESINLCNDEARKKGLSDRVHFRAGDCENTGYEDDQFDVVVESGVLHHLELRAAYAEMARVLKPTGSAVCMEALRHNKLIHAYRKRTPHLRTEWEVAHILGEPEIDLATDYFRLVDKRFFHLTVLAAVPLRSTRSFDRVRSVLDSIDRRLLTLPAIRRQAWLCVFTMIEPTSNGTRVG